jgi:hypothetical protein
MSRDYHSEPIHPMSMRELRALVRLHGANRIIQAVNEIVAAEHAAIKRHLREADAQELIARKLAKDSQK